MLLSEFDIIEQIFNITPGAGRHVICGIGDDAAIVEVPTGHQLVVSTDTLVSGVHFFPDAAPFDIGYKSIAVNLSDLAAMAATPLWATLSLTLPDNTPAWIKEFAEGFFQLANKHGVTLIGGDLTHGPLSITIQLMGIVPDNKALTRSSAQPDDNIYVTGQLGLAGLALAILTGENKVYAEPPADCLQRLLWPVPRVELAIAFRDIANAAIDISDGLAADLGHIVKLSEVGAEVELAKIPVSDELRKLDRDEMWRYATGSGDDYELCFTAAEEYEPALAELAKVNNILITKIGRINRYSGIRWLAPDGIEVPLTGTGYRHF